MWFVSNNLTCLTRRPSRGPEPFRVHLGHSEPIWAILSPFEGPSIWLKSASKWFKHDSEMSQETPNWDNSRRIMLKVPSRPLPSRPWTYTESNTQESEKLEEAEAPSAPSAPSTPHWDDIDGAVGKDGAVGADGASQWSDTLSARTDEKKLGILLLSFLYACVHVSTCSILILVSFAICFCSMAPTTMSFASSTEWRQWCFVRSFKRRMPRATRRTYTFQCFKHVCRECVPMCSVQILEKLTGHDPDLTGQNMQPNHIESIAFKERSVLSSLEPGALAQASMLSPVGRVFSFCVFLCQILIYVCLFGLS